MTRCRASLSANAWLLALCLGLSGIGCSFSPSFPEGTIACTDNAGCPSGFTCMSGFCRSKAVDAANPADAPGLAADQAIAGLDSAPVDSGVSEAGRDGSTTILDGSAERALDVGADRFVAGDAPLGWDTGDTGSTGVDSGIDSAADGAADSAADAPAVTCLPPQCNPGEARCGSTGGVETCRGTPGTCGTWASEVRCDGRKVCQGSAPTASCQCPAPPAGCEGGAGSGCAGKTLRTCKVGAADGCVYEDSAKVCPDATPCSGDFPKAVCQCPAPPAACNGAQGAFCSSTSEVASCGLDVNGCLAVLQKTPCPSGKPCTGTFPSANCSCPAGPPECQNTSGTLCPGPGQLKTCGLNSEGCIAVLSTVDCPAGKTCQGALPTAQCLCPAPPAECQQGVGQSCDSSGNVLTCALDGNGCMTLTRTSCPGSKVCQGTFPSAQCNCPAVPPGCSAGAGYGCSGTDVLKCFVDGSGCMQSSIGACPAGKPCAGSFPDATCTCPTPPSYCTSAGNVCASSTVLATCAIDGNGCMGATTVACSDTTKECTGTMPNAACTCPATPQDCSRGEGSYCSGTTTSIKCALNQFQCMTSSKSICLAGNYCYADFPNGICVDNQPLGPYADLGAQGTRTAGYLMGYAISAPVDFTLRRLGVLAKGLATGNVKIGLYKPQTVAKVWDLVAVVDGAQIAPGRNEYVPDRGSTVALTAGTYWMLVSYSSQMIISQDKSTSTSYVAFTVASFTDPLPPSITNPTTNLQQGPLSNYYLLVSPR